MFSLSIYPQTGVSILIMSAIIVAILSGIAVKNMIWMILTPDMLLVAALMPLSGFMLGYVISIICGLSPQ